jgi:uncharacterized RDD family membrane protein YckC
MEKRITITTPEQVEFSYELAGLGSRFLAFLIDSLIKSASILIIWILLSLIGAHIHLDLTAKTENLVTSYLSLSTLVLGGLAGFIVIGYYVFFETLWNGQTPGKKLAGLRVMKENGRSINIFDAAARNFLRAVDFLPSFYLLGSILVQFNGRGKRMGDMAAGTVVVKCENETPPVPFPELEVAPPPVQLPLERLGAEEHHLVRSFITRRNELSSDTRSRLAHLIVSVVMKKLSLTENPFTAEEDLLEWVILDYGNAEKPRPGEDQAPILPS